MKIIGALINMLNKFVKRLLGTGPTPVAADENKLPWLKIATDELNHAEIPGPENNPRILEYHSSTTLKATSDEVPWCSAFVTWCLEKAGMASTKSAWARSYLNYGQPLTEPRYGCIVVFARGATSGHVGFYISENADEVLVFGGNQSDKVCMAYYSKRLVLGYRWPVISDSVSQPIS